MSGRPALEGNCRQDAVSYSIAIRNNRVGRQSSRLPEFCIRQQRDTLGCLHQRDDECVRLRECRKCSTCLAHAVRDRDDVTRGITPFDSGLKLKGVFKFVAKALRSWQFIVSQLSPGLQQDRTHARTMELRGSVVDRRDPYLPTRRNLNSGNGFSEIHRVGLAPVDLGLSGSEQRTSRRREDQPAEEYCLSRAHESRTAIAVPTARRPSTNNPA